MASNGKKKTTMAKIMRENSVRERRADKQAKKDARKQAARDGVPAVADMVEETGGMQPAVELGRLDRFGDPVGGAVGSDR